MSCALQAGCTNRVEVQVQEYRHRHSNFARLYAISGTTYEASPLPVQAFLEYVILIPGLSGEHPILFLVYLSRRTSIAGEVRTPIAT